MYKEKKVFVVVPAYNEEKLISKVIETMPEYIDRIIVIDDASKDNTWEILQELSKRYPERLCTIKHAKNEGVGGAIVTGYKWCRENRADIAVVMAGDAQMDPADLPALL